MKMKAEYAADDRDTTHNNNTPITTSTTTANHPYTTTPTPILPPPTSSNINNMFSAFHQQPPKSQPHPLPQLPFHHPQFLHHHHFNLDPSSNPNPPHHQQSQTSSERSDSPAPNPTPSTSTPPPSKKPKQHGTTPTTTTTTELDGATIEVVRRPRGRPPGSKNKPKPPVIITKEPESPSMSPYILEVPSSSDIIESLTRFTHRRNINICILNGSGSVTNVTLKQPSNGTTAPSTVTFHGRFDILSISAVLMGGAATFGGGNDNGVFSISLAGPHGQIVGGKVVGSLIASGTVFVIAAGFGNPSYHRLANIGDEDQRVSGAGSQHGGMQQQQSGNSPGGSGSGGGGEGGGGVQGGIGLYSCHLGSDIIWAPPPVARPVPQHPHPQHQQSPY